MSNVTLQAVGVTGGDDTCASDTAGQGGPGSARVSGYL